MYSKYEHAAINRLLDKPVKKSVIIHDFSDDKDINYVGPGICNVSSEQQFEGKNTLKVVTPKKREAEDPNHPFSYGCGRMRMYFEGEDWSAYNRISFWVYPVRDVYENAWFSMELQNDGEVKYPRIGKRMEGVHYVNAVAGKWNHIVWEIPDVPRDKVIQFQINFEVKGKLPEENNENIAYVSTLELQSVETDKYVGWDTDGKIIISHSGYTPEQSKIACISASDVDEFSVINADTEKEVLVGKAEKVVLDIGEFYQLDFSELHREGKYYLTCGNVKSHVFAIDKDVWLPAAEKIRKFFYTERCGVEVEGVHSACHTDCYMEHPDGRTLPAYGGWHDAGDMSQFLCNTAEGVQTFLDTAKAVKEKYPNLYDTCIEEAKQGLGWLLSTQFEDGYRMLRIFIRVMTDGEKDSCSGLCGNKPTESFESLCAASAEATAYETYKDIDEGFAKQCLKAAKLDFAYAMKHMDEEPDADYYCAPVQLAGEVVFAAVHLYDATGECAYLETAVKYAEKICRCQQTVPTDWDIPFVGFFYEDEEHSNTLTYNHQAHEQIVIQAFAELLKRLPNHEEAVKWKQALELYRAYILKLNEFSAPYGLLPSAIYFKSKVAKAKNNSSNQEFLKEEYEKQVENGIKLNKDVYLRRIPVMTLFRGGFGVWLTKAKAVSVLARALKDEQLLDIAHRQLQWVVGNNPFNKSYMYGEGYDYPNMFTEFFADVEGEIPVGIQCYEDTDIPHMPMASSATYFEVYVHPAARFLWTLADLF